MSPPLHTANTHPCIGPHLKIPFMKDVAKSSQFSLLAWGGQIPGGGCRF